MMIVMMVEVLEVPGGDGTHKFRLLVSRPQTLTVFKDKTNEN